MPLYHLRPVAARLTDPNWLASAHRAPCCVAAECEDAARCRVGMAFALVPWEAAAELAAAGRSARGISPWLQPRLVEVRELAYAGDAEPVAGRIFVPVDADRPDGPFVPLGD